METRLREKLDDLKTEYEKGTRTLEELDGQAASVRATLLRISGAIQVIQEILQEEQGQPAPPDPPPPTA